MSLFELTNQYRELLQKIEDDPDMDPEVVKDTIASIEESMNDKYDHIWTFIKSLQAEADMRDEYVKKSQATSRSLKNKIASLKKYALQEMNAAGKKKIVTDHYRISIRNGHKVEITDPSLVPKEFLKEQAPKFDKKEMTRAFKSGKEIPGAEYVDSQSLLGR